MFGKQINSLHDVVCTVVSQQEVSGSVPVDGRDFVWFLRRFTLGSLEACWTCKIAADTQLPEAL